jgi:hypothetical protein
MINFFKAFFAFVAGVFTDGDKPSFSRVCSFMLLVAVIKWSSRIVVAKGEIPDLLYPMLAVALLYGINQVSGIASLWVQAKTSTPGRAS